MLGAGKAVLAATVLLLLVHPANATYNANMSGRVTWVSTYMDGDYIYFHLDNQPTSHPQCNPSIFVITADVPQNRRNQAFAQLLAAKQTGEPIAIGFDNSGDCADGYIRVHRVG
jgi:hypothetical protein